MKACVISFCCVTILATSLPAQIVISECVQPRIKAAMRGQTVRVDCDSVFVYNPAMIHVRDSLNKVNAALAAHADSLTARLQALGAVRDSIDSAKTAMIREFRELVRVQSMAYDSLRGLFATTDSVARASTANTDRALGYIRKVKAASYVSSALAGGVIGGFGIKPGGESGFHWSGAALGAVVGVVTNFLLMKLVH
jgi:hypothetical protein